MGNLTLQLDSIALREATTQAIMGILTPEIRAQILEKAISALLTPSTGLYENKKSQLELAFEWAVNQVAHDEAKRMINEDPAMRERVKEMLRLTADKVLNADMDKLAERMSDAFVSSMRKD